MIYFLAYIIIGMVWSSIGITSTIKSVQDKQGSEAAKGTGTDIKHTGCRAIRTVLADVSNR